MDEDHPTIGLAMFRLSSDGILEMLGQNHLKHGFFALSSNQCNLGCTPSDGSYLGIGCSDTYSAGHNGNRYDLGPRHEVDPTNGVWVACGSWFDDWNTPDADCNRDYFGAAPDGAYHRLEVHDSDLGRPGATYYYEGEYIVRQDSDLQNSIGWRGPGTLVITAVPLDARYSRISPCTCRGAWPMALSSANASGSNAPGALPQLCVGLAAFAAVALPGVFVLGDAPLRETVRRVLARLLRGGRG